MPPPTEEAKCHLCLRNVERYLCLRKDINVKSRDRDDTFPPSFLRLKTLEWRRDDDCRAETMDPRPLLALVVADAEPSGVVDHLDFHRLRDGMRLPVLPFTAAFYAHGNDLFVRRPHVDTESAGDFLRDLVTLRRLEVKRLRHRNRTQIEVIVEIEEIGRASCRE